MFAERLQVGGLGGLQVRGLIISFPGCNYSKNTYNTTCYKGYLVQSFARHCEPIPVHVPT